MLLHLQPWERLTHHVPHLAKVHVGLDVHKDSISIAVANRPSEFDSLELVDCVQIRNTPSLMKKRVERLSEEFGHHLHFIYEAGPRGYYGLLWRLRAAGWRCD